MDETNTIQNVYVYELPVQNTNRPSNLLQALSDRILTTCKRKTHRNVREGPCIEGAWREATSHKSAFLFNN